MAETNIADIYEPTTFNALVDQAAVEKNAFLASGVIVEDNVLSSMAAAGGRSGELAYNNALADADPNISTDVAATTSTPAEITGGQQNWRLAMLNQAWSTMDLARELALKDPLGGITDKIGQYWATQNQKRVVSMCMGILADNVANDSGDMVNNIATDNVAAVTSAEKISGDAVVDTFQTLGDAAGSLAVIAMHSVVYSELQKQNLIATIRNSEGVVMFETYLGKRVVVDDGLSAVSGTNRITYTTMLFGTGAIGHGKGAPVVPSELERVPRAGNGGGQDIIHSRQSDIYHVYGTSFVGSPASTSPTRAELAAATSWNRVFSRKNIPVAFLQTNG
jgi:hypothetical protein